MRSRSKQGNRRNRRKLKVGGKLVRDTNGNVLTVGLLRPLPDHWKLVEKHRKQAAFWERIKRERLAKAEEEAERERMRLTTPS